MKRKESRHFILLDDSDARRCNNTYKLDLTLKEEEISEMGRS